MKGRFNGGGGGLEHPVKSNRQGPVLHQQKWTFLLGPQEEEVLEIFPLLAFLGDVFYVKNLGEEFLFLMNPFEVVLKLKNSIDF